MIFQGLSVARNCPAPVTILDIKRTFCNELIWEICNENDSYLINILTKASLK